MKTLLLAGVFAVFFAANSASASPCGADPMPVGSTFRGPVLHVLDGATLCVALSPAPAEWAELRLADAPQESSRNLLMAVAFAHDVDCIVVEAQGAAPAAMCSIDGRSLGELARDPEAREQALAWR